MPQSYTNVNVNVNKNVLTRPSVFSEILHSLNDQFPSLLDDYKKAYVYYKMAPSYGEYENNFTNIQNNIMSANSKLFMTTNSIEQNIDLINSNLVALNENIENEKALNTKLKTNYDLIGSDIGSSKQRIDDYNETYKLKYLNNISIFIGVVIGIIACRKIF